MDFTAVRNIISDFPLMLGQQDPGDVLVVYRVILPSSLELGYFRFICRCRYF